MNPMKYNKRQIQQSKIKLGNELQQLSEYLKLKEKKPKNT